MTLIKDLIEIPDRVYKDQYVLRLSEGVTRPDETLSDYVVTPELTTCFDAALSMIRSAVTNRTSKAAFLHGSFGSGKSHYYWPASSSFSPGSSSGTMKSTPSSASPWATTLRASSRKRPGNWAKRFPRSRRGSLRNGPLAAPERRAAGRARRFGGVRKLLILRRNRVPGFAERRKLGRAARGRQEENHLNYRVTSNWG